MEKPKLQKTEEEIKKQNLNLYRETNEKFIGRVENLLFYICGCSKERAVEVLEETIKKIKDEQKTKTKTSKGIHRRKRSSRI